MQDTGGIINIGKKDVYWNYVATFFHIGSGVILLPFILKMLPSETVGIWTVFQTVTSLVAMLDFGFKPSFSRNISYVFSGVRELKKTGISSYDGDMAVDYGLLNATITAMRQFYRWMSLAVLLFLLTAGSAYFHHILQSYGGDKQDAYIAWGLLICISCYNLYTFYYDALLQGKGYVKRSKQINIIGQVAYLVVAIVLVCLGFGLTAIVSAQLIAFVIRRSLSYRVFFTKEMKERLADQGDSSRKILRVIFPNAVKVGLTQVGGFLVLKSAVFIGSAYLTLSEIAHYGITSQVVDILAGLAGVYYQSYVAKLAEYRVKNDFGQLTRIYVKSVVMQVGVYVVGGAGLVLFGNWFLGLIGSETSFLPASMFVVMLIVSLLEKNHALAAGFLMAKNEVPFFKASLISGAATVLLLWLMLGWLHWGMWGMILAPGIAQLAYQNWKWPIVLIKELKIGKA